MPTPVVRQHAGWSQDKQRGFFVFYDQHKDERYTDATGAKLFLNGRPWGAVVERAANGAAMPMPVGPIQPLGWSAPWYPDQKYIVKSLGKVASAHGALTQTGQQDRFRIDYEAMRRDLAKAHQEYYDMAVQEHVRMLPGVEVPGPGSVMPYQIVSIIGVPPKSPKIPEAALAGHRWLLGMDKTPDEGLATLLKRSRVDILTNQQVRAVQGDAAAELEKVKAMVQALLAEREAERLSAKHGKKKGKSSDAPDGAE